MVEPPPEIEECFGFNHKVMILKESSPNIMITRKPIVCESLGKETSYVRERQFTPAHPTYDKLHCLLIVISKSCFYLLASFIKI